MGMIVHATVCVVQDADASYDINDLDTDPMPRYDAADDNRYPTPPRASLSIRFTYLPRYLQ